MADDRGTNVNGPDDRRSDDALPGGAGGHAIRLRESEDLLALAEEAGRLGIFEWQVQSGTIRPSPNYLSIYGLTDFDGRYDSWIKCVFREDLPRVSNERTIGTENTFGARV